VDLSPSDKRCPLVTAKNLKAIHPTHRVDIIPKSIQEDGHMDDVANVKAQEVQIDDQISRYFNC
jgi:hypothetical protein